MSVLVEMRIIVHSLTSWFPSTAVITLAPLNNVSKSAKLVLIVQEMELKLFVVPTTLANHLKIVLAKARMIVPSLDS